MLRDYTRDLLRGSLSVAQASEFGGRGDDHGLSTIKLFHAFGQPSE